MIQNIYEFMFITVPWYAWYAFGILCLVIAFYPAGDNE